MKYTDCHSCDKKAIPLNETLNIDGKNYCEDCLEQYFNTEESIKGKEVKQNIDDTICFSCGKSDFLQSLEKISEYPVCSDCKQNIRNREFPMWVKTFFVAVLAIVAFSFYWNWKYYTAYKDIQSAYSYAAEGEYPKASVAIKEAEEIVPEVQDIHILGSYIRGLEYLSADSSLAALEAFEMCKDYLPPSYDIDFLMTNAKIGVSFDTKNYPAFLKNAEDLLAYDSTMAIYWASVASAHACLYVETGSSEEKKLANEFLAKARLIDSTSNEGLDFYQKIKYRLHSKKILTSEEFDQQFPNGWKEN